MCSWATRGCTRTTVRWRCWPPIPTPIASSFRFLTSSRAPWEDKLAKSTRENFPRKQSGKSSIMVEELEESGWGGFDLEHYLGIVRRRHMQFLIPLLAGWLLIWGMSWVLPARYRSTTLILVEQPTMPKDYVTPNVNDDLQDRLRSITEQILSRTRLLHIIDQLNLYADSHGRLTADDKV